MLDGQDSGIAGARAGPLSCERGAHSRCVTFPRRPTFREETANLPPPSGEFSPLGDCLAWTTVDRGLDPRGLEVFTLATAGEGEIL
jgi:hypothetical protein